jgi:CRISPR/Cas system CSM-associated protein Csm4 (group 5 of RAMP superfamily)
MGLFGKVFDAKKEEPKIKVPQTHFENLTSLPSFPSRSFNLPSYPEPKKESVKETVFIRLDKFESSEKSFDDIKAKLKKIESNIKAVDELTELQSEKLAGWSKSLERVKIILSSIDEKVFNQI